MRGIGEVIGNPSKKCPFVEACLLSTMRSTSTDFIGEIVGKAEVL